MKKIILLFILVLGILIFVPFKETNSAGPTGISGNITENTTWTLENSPYIVTNTVQVLEGITLTVEAGVTVKFEDNTSLIIGGELLAIGTDYAMITFTSNQATPEPYDWNTIYFTDDATGATFDENDEYVSGSILKYCIVEYGRGISTLSDVYITDNIIRFNQSSGTVDNKGGGITNRANETRIFNNTISDNSGSEGGGIYNSSESQNTKIEDNIISNNVLWNNSGDGGGIFNNANDVVIKNNTISNNSARYGGGIYNSSHNTEITRNVIDGNIVDNIHDGAGIYTYGFVLIDDNRLINHTTYGADTIHDEYELSNHTQITSNTISNNAKGIYSRNGVISGNVIRNNTQWGINGTYSITNNIVENNAEGGIIASNTTTLENNSVINNGFIGIDLFNPQPTLAITNNNIYGNSSYNIKNNSGLDVIATNNYWGTVIESEINEKIYDYYDDITLGEVIYDPFAMSPVMPIVEILGAPNDWTNEYQTAFVACEDTVGAECDYETFKYKTYYTDIGSCGEEDPSTFTTDQSVVISQHLWVCAHACDIYGSCAFSETAEEFLVDRISPNMQAPTSDTHTELVWGLPDVHFLIGDSWDYGAYDGQTFYPGSGIAGYSFNCSEETPDQIIDLDGESTDFNCNFSDGIHNFVSIMAVDHAGNWNVDSQAGPFWIDGTPPNLWDYTENRIENSPFHVGISADDGGGSGIAGYQWSVVSGPDVGSVIFGQPNNDNTLVTIGGPDGIYIIRQTVTDNVGNEATGDITVTWDTTNPSVQLNNPDNNSIFNGPIVNTSFTVSDTVSGVGSCNFYDNGELRSNVPINANGPIEKEQWFIYPDGPHEWYVSCSDLAGNLFSSTHRLFTMVSPPDWQYSELLINGDFELGSSGWVGDTDRIGYFPADGPWHSGLQGINYDLSNYAINQTIQIPHSSNDLFLSFWYKSNWDDRCLIKIFEFSNPNNIYYEYACSGPSNDWINVGDVLEGLPGEKVVLQIASSGPTNSPILLDDFSLIAKISDTISPTATISYSTTEPINGNVVATLNPSEEVIVTNNDGSDEYTFTANGSFTFKYKDLAGNTGSKTATVSNIDKTAPTATINYSTTETTTDNVIATLEPSEGVIVTNNGGKQTYTFTKNGSFTFKFKDEAGNTGTKKAVVNNIKGESELPDPPTELPIDPEPEVKGEEIYPTVIVTGTKQGGGPEVRVFTSEGELLYSFNAYNETFRGGVNVAIGDIDGDGTNEIVTAPGIGGGPQIRIFDLEGNHKDLDFFAYDTGFRGGVNIAVGDVDGGKAEIITAPMSAGGPNTRVFGYRDGSIQPTTENFMAYDPNFRGGVAVSVGDLDGGKGEIVTTPISRGGPHIRIFGYRDRVFRPVVLGIMAYAESFRGGINSTTGDIDGNGTAEIITGVVKDGGPHVRIFGRIDEKIDLMDPGFMAYDPEFRGGISVASCDLNDDGKAEIITGVGSNSSPLVRIFNREGVQVLPEFMAYKTDYKNGITLACGELR